MNWQQYERQCCRVPLQFTCFSACDVTQDGGQPRKLAGILIIGARQYYALYWVGGGLCR